MAVPTIKLNNGSAMPIVGFGLWKISKEVTADQVYSAIKAGYRLLDGACSKSARLIAAEAGTYARL